MNVKGAAIGLGGHAAMLANFIAFSDPLGRGLPGRIANGICSLSEILSNEVVNLVASIPKHLARMRAESCPCPLGWFSADLARLTGQGSLFALHRGHARAGAELGLVASIGSTMELLPAMQAYIRFALGLPIALVRAECYLVNPILHGCGDFLSKCFAAGLAGFGRFFSDHRGMIPCRA